MLESIKNPNEETITFSLIYEHNITNALNYLPQRKLDDLIKEGKGNSELPIGRKNIHGVQYWLVPSKVKLDGSTFQMLDYLIKKITESTYRTATKEEILANREIEIDLKEVSKLFGKTMNGTKKMVLRTVESLANIKIDRLDIPLKRNVVVKNNSDIIKWSFPIVSAIGKYLNNKSIKNSRMRVELHVKLVEMLPKEAYLMYYPDALFRINTARYPNAFLFGRRLCLHYRQNQKKNNSNSINVETLLNLALEIPKYDDIKKTGSIRQRIIAPFIRDMDVLVKMNVLSEWHLEDLFSKELIDCPKTVTWKQFINSKLVFELKEYPHKNL